MVNFIRCRRHTSPGIRPHPPCPFFHSSMVINTRVSLFRPCRLKPLLDLTQQPTIGLSAVPPLLVVILEAISEPVSYTHLRAHETPEHLVCRLLLEKKKKKITKKIQ
eukprot:TRINITY_DN5765_c0_g1_i6.p1 TRINITY_DN5765_c0_g1~~TRINITY_DN5765_c0_g1_i6.p1  ORF type:complete len:107 (+),score=13.03 TRINITY_DN5765_c0_g1_i6:175-495(+)